MHPKLVWVTTLSRDLSFLILCTVEPVINDTVDPLLKLVVLNLGDNLKKGDFFHIQNIAHGFAKANDCTIQRIRKAPKQLIMEISTKTRLGEIQDNSPFSRDKAGSGGT